MITKFWVLILSALLSGILHGQDLSVSLQEATLDFANPPANHLLDLGEVFSGNLESRQQLAERLVRLEEEHGFIVYLVAYSGIIGSNVQEKASIFRDFWLEGGKEGLVLVCDTDMRTMGYSLTKSGELTPNGEGRAWKVADHEVMAILSELNQVEESIEGPGNFTSAVGNRLVDQLEERLRERGVPAKPASGLLAIFALFTVLLFLALMLKPKKKPVRDVRAISFPQVQVPERLGASFGGGLAAEIHVKIPASIVSDS